jgi:hypothetical protein
MLIFQSANLLICSSAHLLICSSAHLLICSSAHTSLLFFSLPSQVAKRQATTTLSHQEGIATTIASFDIRHNDDDDDDAFGHHVERMFAVRYL